MADRDAQRFRRLAAELRAEGVRVLRTAAEASSAAEVLSVGDVERLSLYGSAAILDSFYTGVEKAFTRIAEHFGGVPQGPAWHRTLLDDMTLTIAKSRPAVISVETARALDAYLGFRHRFRHLYVFDLESAPMLPLLRAIPDAAARFEEDLKAFATHLEALADAVDASQ